MIPDTKPAEWFSFTRVAKALDERKWWWGSDASELKYINVRIDTRDNHCVVEFQDRDGKVFVRSIGEFEELMSKLDANKTDNFTHQAMKPVMKR